MSGRRRTSLLTTARIKSFASLSAVVTSSIISVYTAVKTPSNDSSAKAYDALRSEVLAQRMEIAQLYKVVADQRTWLNDWRRYQADKENDMQQMMVDGPGHPVISSVDAGFKPPPVVPQQPKSSLVLPSGASFF